MRGYRALPFKKSTKSMHFLKISLRVSFTIVYFFHSLDSEKFFKSALLYLVVLGQVMNSWDHVQQISFVHFGIARVLLSVFGSHEFP